MGLVPQQCSIVLHAFTTPAHDNPAQVMTSLSTTTRADATVCMQLQWPGMATVCWPCVSKSELLQHGVIICSHTFLPLSRAQSHPHMQHAV